MKVNAKEMTQRERLETLVIYLRITLRDLARWVGLNENTLYHVSSGKGTLSARTAARICYFLEKEKGVLVNRDWLLTGEGEMIDEKHSVLSYEQEEEDGNGLIAAEEPAPYGGVDWKAKYLALMEQYITLQREYTELLKGKQ